MSGVSLKQAYDVRKAEANDRSAQFDFESEGSLATFWRQATPGTAYWRCYLPAKHLPGQVQGIGPHSLAEDDDGFLVLNHQAGDTAIWQFLGDDGRSRIARQMQRQGLNTLMELDDSYLRPAPMLHGTKSAWTKTHMEAARQGTFYSIEMHRKLVPRMDGLIVSTPYLADEYEKLNPNISICPNSVDPDDWDVPRTESDVLRIGYYGSPSHTRDWPLAKKAMKWAERQPDVEVILMGFAPPGWSGRVAPWSDDLWEARNNLGNIDVGIAPLTVNRWSNAKSDVKALEYAMAGVMPILQDAEPYSPWKEDIGWPYMASTESDWMEQIQHIVKNRDKVKEEAWNAKQYVLMERTIQDNIHYWKEALGG